MGITRYRQSISGYSGKSGFSGISGYSGASGFSGVSGYSGVSGFSGRSGFSGVSGYSGVSGFSGANPGASGFSGASGYSGVSGFSGVSGISGFSGISGYSGRSGFSGQGASGYSGMAATMLADVIDDSGSTSAAYVEIFAVAEADGLMGIGTVQNTGAESLTIRETVIDKFGSTRSVVNEVPAGDDYMLDLQTKFQDLDITAGYALPPYIYYSVELTSTNPTSGDTTYELHFVSGLFGGAGQSEAAANAAMRAITFF